MILLTPMTPEVFEAFKVQSQKEYSTNLVRVENIPFDEALKNAVEQFSRLVPNGLATEGQFFFEGIEEKSGDSIGFLWLGIQIRFGRKVASINDIIVHANRRNQGFGKALMKCVEAEAKKAGAKRVRLHVFQHNEVAKQLYQSMGFQISSVDMYKLV